MLSRSEAAPSSWLLGLFGVWLFQDHIQNHFVLPIYLALVCIPLYALTDVQDGIGRGNAWMSVALVPPYILRPLLLLAAMFVANASGTADGRRDGRRRRNRRDLADRHPASAYLSTGACSATIPAGPRHSDFAAWFTISLPLLVISSAELLLQNTDILVVSRFMSPADVGIYFAAGKTMALIMFVHYAVGSAVAHKFASLNARGDKEGLRHFVKDAVNWTFWPSLASALVILALGKPLLSLFGPQFADRLSGHVHSCFRLSLPLCDGPGRIPAEHARRTEALRRRAYSRGDVQHRAQFRSGADVWIDRCSERHSNIADRRQRLVERLVVWRRLDIKIAIWENLPKF